MAEVTREQWTKAAFKIADHLKDLEKIVSSLGFEDLCMGISTSPEGCSFAFHLERNEDNEVVKSFDVERCGDLILFKEDNSPYKEYKCT